MAYLFLREHGKETKQKLLSVFMRGWLISFLFWLALMLTCTVLERTSTYPFKSIFDDFGIRNKGSWNTEFVQNVLVFVPYVFLYLQAFKPEKPMKAALILSLCTTLFIELSQLLFWLGEFQFSDILHNVEGGMVGCGLWYTVKAERDNHLLRRWFERIWKRKKE